MKFTEYDVHLPGIESEVAQQAASHRIAAAYSEDRNPMEVVVNKSDTRFASLAPDYVNGWILPLDLNGSEIGSDTLSLFAAIRAYHLGTPEDLENVKRWSPGNLSLLEKRQQLGEIARRMVDEIDEHQEQQLIAPFINQLEADEAFPFEQPN